MAETAQGDKPKKRINKVWIISIAAVLVLAVGGALAYFLIKDDNNGTQQQEDERDSYTAAVEDADKAAVQGNTQEAVEIYDEGIANTDQENEKASLYIMKAYTLLGSEDYEDALSVAQEAEDLYGSVSTADLLGDVYAAMGDTEEARQAYQTAIDRLNPEDYDYDNSRSLLQSKIDEL